MISSTDARPPYAVYASLMLLSFYLGLPLKIGALALLALLLVSLRWPVSSQRVHQFGESLLQILVFIYPLFVLSIQLVRLKMGGQGVDFAIFSQSVHSVSIGRQLETSLIDWKPHNFLTHHFSPYLFVAGYINAFFDSAEIVLLVLHSCAIALLLRQIFLLIIDHQRDSSLGYLACCLAILLPAPRIGLLWEVRDEVYALPFLLLAYRSISRDNHRSAIAALIFTFFFKETLFIVAAFFSVMAIIRLFSESPLSCRRYAWHYALVTCAGFGAFIAYSRLLPGWLFWPTFCAQCRISTWEQLWSWDLLKDKLYWLSTLLAPHIFLILIPLFELFKTEGQTGRKLLRSFVTLGASLAPASAFIGMIAISNFPASFNPYNYYSIAPSLLLLTASLRSVLSLPMPKQRLLLLLSCLVAVAIGPRGRFTREWNTALRSSSPIESLVEFIRPEDTIIAGDYDVTFFTRQKRVIRLFHANRNRLPFDLIVQRKTGPAPSISIPLSRYLLDRSRVCFEDDNWVVRCRHGLNRG